MEMHIWCAYKLRAHKIRTYRWMETTLKKSPFCR